MKAPRTTDRTLGFDVTPMIDVVFLLIVFFLVSSHLAKQENQASVALPTAASGAMADDESARVTLSVLPSGEVQLGGAVVDPAGLTERLREERSRLGDALELRLRADRAARFGVVQPILRSCSEAGVWNVAFAVEQGNP